MKSRVVFVTGTNTSVGKTVLSCLLTRALLQNGESARAVKPLCSGGRDDAVALRAAQTNGWTLDEINPWHFKSPLTPLLSARRKGRKVRQPDVLRFLRKAKETCNVLLVEGAGGLLSPLGEGFSSRELIVELRATPVVVCPNRLGAINQSRLVIEALPASLARRVQIVLMSRPHADSSAKSNATVLRELTGRDCVHDFPWLGAIVSAATVKLDGKLKRATQRLVASL